MPKGGKKKVGDIGLGLELKRIRDEYHRMEAHFDALLAEKHEEVKAAVRAFQKSGAGLTSIGEFYGSKDRRTIIDILREEVDDE